MPVRRHTLFVWGGGSLALFLCAITVARAADSSLSPEGGGLTLAPRAPGLAAQGQGSPRTIWNGVYTDAQAARGNEVFARVCTYCHLDDLSGSLEDNAPSLVDSAFADRWRGLTVAEMVRTVSRSMPKKAPGSLKAQDYLDVVAYIFKANQAPSGAAELPMDLKALEQMRIVDKPGLP